MSILSSLAVPAALAMSLLAGAEAVQIYGWPFLGGGYKAEISSLNDRIDNPTTGYVVRLGQAHANEATLSNGLSSCNASIDRMASESGKTTQVANDALALLRASHVVQQKQVAAILAAKPVGDLCQAADNLILRSVMP